MVGTYGYCKSCKKKAEEFIFSKLDSLSLHTCCIIVLHKVICASNIPCMSCPRDVVTDKGQGLKKYDLCEQQCYVLGWVSVHVVPMLHVCICVCEVMVTRV